MQRSVSETRRSVATRPKSSSESAGAHRASLGGARSSRGGRAGSVRPGGYCRRREVHAQPAVGALRGRGGAAGLRLPTCSASGSSTGCTTGSRPTRRRGPTSRPTPPRSTTCSPSAAPRRRATSGGGSPRPAPTCPTRPSWCATRPARAPPASTSSPRCAPPPAPRCSWTAAGWHRQRRHRPGRRPRAAVGDGHRRRLGARRRHRAGRPPSPTGSTRAISSVEIGRTLDVPVYGGFVDVERETPRARPAGARRAARPRQRAALLLRPAVVVLRGARRLRVLLPGLRRAPQGPAGPAAGVGGSRAALRASGASRRRRGASRR